MIHKLKWTSQQEGEIEQYKEVTGMLAKPMTERIIHEWPCEIMEKSSRKSYYHGYNREENDGENNNHLPRQKLKEIIFCITGNEDS